MFYSILWSHKNYANEYKNAILGITIRNFQVVYEFYARAACDQSKVVCLSVCLTVCVCVAGHKLKVAKNFHNLELKLGHEILPEQSLHHKLISPECGTIKGLSCPLGSLQVRQQGQQQWQL